MIAPRVLIVDTETTDASPDAEVIEIATAELDAPTGALYNRFTMRFRPTRPISFGAMATHHILPSDLEDCLPASHAAFKPEIRFIIGHNIDFDWHALGEPNVKRICTLALARALWPTLDNHKLGTVLYSLIPPQDARARLRDQHNASADVENVATILACIATEMKPTSWGDLWRMSEDARVPRYITFGKHKPKEGEPPKPYADLPRSYLEWMLKELDMDQYVKVVARRALGMPEGTA